MQLSVDLLSGYVSGQTKGFHTLIFLNSERCSGTWNEECTAVTLRRKLSLEGKQAVMTADICGLLSFA